jgi:plasmid stability protein
LQFSVCFDIIDIKEDRAMSDLLIRNIDTDLKRRLKASARRNRRSLSEEARMLLKSALFLSAQKRGMGTALLELLPERYRGDDLIFAVPGALSKPPNFE